MPFATARRVAAWLSTYACQEQHPLIHDEWVTTFESDHSELVLTKDIPFVALCEHHLLPFRGRAAIGYIPKGRILGLSKFARLLQIPCGVPTLQETITTLVADALMSALDPLGVAVVLYDVEHTCMTTRGVLAHGASTTTSAIRGVFRDGPEAPQARNEFLQLLH